MDTGNHTEKREARLRMLGGFSLSLDGKTISDEGNQMNRLWSILSYLMLHRDRAVPQSEFIELFFSSKDGAGPINALKTRLFRIRRLLKPLFSDDISPIISQRGGYHWNPEIPVRLDVEDLKILYQRFLRTDNSEAKQDAIFADMFELYRGQFLPKLQKQDWVRAVEKDCRNMYLTMMEAYVETLEKRGMYEKMIEVLTKAVEIYPLHEFFHTGIVRAYICQNKYTEALVHYNDATDLFFQNLGMQPWKELRLLYDQLMSTEQLFQTDLTVIQEELVESERQVGAFFCEYGAFRGIYRLEARRAARSGTETHIVLLTVLYGDNTIPPAKTLQSAMEKLKLTIFGSLRSGDVFTRYSSAQYLIMLPETSQQDTEQIVDRITSKLWRYRTPPLKAFARICKMTPL